MRFSHTSSGEHRKRLAKLMTVGVWLLIPGVATAQHGTPPVTHDTTSMSTGTPDTMPGMGTRHTSRPPQPLGISMSRTGSGTSWLPDAAPMHAAHFTAGPWELMVHYSVFAYYDRQNDANTGRRGADQIGSVNWGMLMAARAIGGGRLRLRGMFSAEPWTVGAKGYPLLLQSGESYRGMPLHDRQHPHDLFMELAADYERAIRPNLALQLYVAPVGEPASGPVAFPHRPSAAADPFAPLSHHWQDATHITFGVVTGAVYSRVWKLEGSIFNGREPDDDRTDFDFRTLDSYAGRITVNPASEWSVSASYAYLRSPEVLFPGDAEHRITASVLHSRPIGVHGDWSSAFIWGANRHSAEGGLSNSFLLESTVDLDGRNTLFGRVESVSKSADDLAISFESPTPFPGSSMAGAAAGPHYGIRAVAVGYLRELAGFPGGTVDAGVRTSVNFLPAALEPFYGSRTPAGFAVFIRLRPTIMRMAMPGMP